MQIINLLCLVIALLCFLFATVGTNSKLNLTALGLFFLTLGFLINGLGGVK